jgi:hypothetical protein
MQQRVPRDPRVWLAADVARCEPSAQPQCQRSCCARYLAPLPPQGASLADFNIDRSFYSLPCGHWLSAEQARPVAVAPPRPVHPPLGG